MQCNDRQLACGLIVTPTREKPKSHTSWRPHLLEGKVPLLKAALSLLQLSLVRRELFFLKKKLPGLEMSLFHFLFSPGISSLACSEQKLGNLILLKASWSHRRSAGFAVAGLILNASIHEYLHNNV